MALFAGLKAQPGRLAAGLGNAGRCSFGRARLARKGKCMAPRSDAGNRGIGRQNLSGMANKPLKTFGGWYYTYRPACTQACSGSARCSGKCCTRRSGMTAAEIRDDLYPRRLTRFDFAPAARRLADFMERHFHIREQRGEIPCQSRGAADDRVVEAWLGVGWKSKPHRFLQAPARAVAVDGHAALFQSPAFFGYGLARNRKTEARCFFSAAWPRETLQNKGRRHPFLSLLHTLELGAYLERLHKPGTAPSLGRKLFAASGAPAGQHRAALLRCHALAETVLALTAYIAGLIGSLCHCGASSLRRARRAWAHR